MIEKNIKKTLELFAEMWYYNSAQRFVVRHLVSVISFYDEI